MKERTPTRRQAEARRSLKLMRGVLNGFRMRLDEQLRARNVTTAQLRLLNEVKQRPGASGAQIARACEVTPQSAQAMMVRAVARGWVVRGKNAENDRLVTARLTPAGQRLLGHAYAILTGLETEVWAGAGTAELRGFNDVLERGLARLVDGARPTD